MIHAVCTANSKMHDLNLIQRKKMHLRMRTNTNGFQFNDNIVLHSSIQPANLIIF